MNLSAAWKKVLLFGVLGAVGCLAGWLIGEGYLFAADSLMPADAGRVPTLITKPSVPHTEPPPLPNDIRERLEREGGKSGDVQISLIWYNLNDLDLHCMDPNGEEIFYKHRTSRSGGELDVDANAANERGMQRALTNEPVENIYWPKGGAPAGKYQIAINHYFHRQPAPNETSYKVNVLHNGQRHEFEGKIANNGSNSNFRRIYEFELKPSIVIYAPKELELPSGASIKVPVKLQRDSYRGEVEVKVENLPEGVTATKLTIPEDKDEGEVELKAAGSAKSSRQSIKFHATGNNVDSTADTEVKVTELSSSSILLKSISIGIWTAILAVGLSIALLVGQNYYLGKPLFAAGRVPLVLVVLGAVVAGFISGSVGQGLFLLIYMASKTLASVGTIFGWTLLGGLLGLGVSFFVPNLDSKKSAVAGLAGGFFGGLVYAILSSGVVEMLGLGRFGGAAVLGFCIGLMVAVVEAAFRRAWLEVRFSERETITVNLGPEPVKVGGDAKACAVWARGAAPIALKFWIRDNKVYCEDVPARQESVVNPGDSHAAGNVTVVVRTAMSAQVAMPTAPRVAKPSAPPPAPPSATTSATSVPIPTSPASPTKPTNQNWDDGLPMPMSPAAPARPKAASILDVDAPVAPVASAPPVVSTPVKPPTPKAPTPPAPAAPKPPVPSATKAVGDPDACPSCGRKSPGKPGSRYCMVCDRTF